MPGLRLTRGEENDQTRLHLRVSPPPPPSPPAATPDQGRAWVDAILARQTWDTVVPAHATAPIRDGRAAFKACFDFLYQ